jgi:hypothetical protein
MTTRKSISQIHNHWYDGQRVDQVDMVVEQDRNLNIDASIIQNHFGSGVLPSSFTQKILFDSDNLFPDQLVLIASNDFDGTGLRPLTSTTDTSLGNQIEVELTDSDIRGISTVGGRLSTKVLIIGLDFQGNLQYDRFYFYKKEKQVTKKHYAKLLCVYCNDFLGNSNCSRDLGGRILLRETSSYQLSRDAIMIAQDVEPNLFFRDFKISLTTENEDPIITLKQSIQSGIGDEYSVDDLHINTTVKRDFELEINDITTRIAEKFIAKTNNIQKITLLLGVRKDEEVDLINKYDWSGELIVSVYELQSTVACASELIPELAIEFDPKAEPLTQFSIDQSDLEDQGYVLTDVLQPIDFVFNSSLLGNSANPVIVVGKYYAISIGRAGDASIGTLFTGIGNSQTTDDRFSVFASVWTDVPEEDLWYQVWSDTAKIADGFAYDDGKGIEIQKTNINNIGALVDFSMDQLPFSDTGQNTLNTGIISAIREQSQQEQDERTGNPVFARQKYEPSFSFATTTTLVELQASSEPLIIGCARDINAKNNVVIYGTQLYPGLVNTNIFTVINPNPDLISQQLVGSKLIPNDDCAGTGYKITKVRLCTDGYGDVNGDGVIDSTDLHRASELINQSLSLNSTQQAILDGTFTTLEILRADVDGDGYITSNDIDLLSDYISKVTNSFPVGSSFTHLDIEVQNATGRFDGYYDCNNYIRLDGYIGNNIIDPDDLSSIELKYYGWNNVPNINASNPIFTTVPFAPVDFRVRPIQYWKDHLLQFSSEARLVPATFTYADNATYLFDETGVCGDSGPVVCEEVFETMSGSCNPGRNDFFVPNNLIIGKGQILDKDGSLFKQDFEIHSIVLEFPIRKTFVHALLNVFEKFIADNGTGFTSAGYPAVKFADCSFVDSSALTNNQIRFGVAIQSICPSLDGYDSTDGFGIIIDNIIGINIDQTTGILTVGLKDVNNSVVYQELRTKIQITVYLKKSGFNNTPLVVHYNQVAGLFTSGVTTVI